jgi:hypothetical protein
MQAGRRMELHFDLAKEADDAAPVFESSAAVDLQSSRDGGAVAILRRCGDGTNVRSAARLPAPARRATALPQARQRPACALR